jgi:uncharacterized protein
VEFDTALLALIAAGFLSGLVDAMVGGGGLIQVPALSLLFPGSAPAAIMGTSKIAGIFGTAAAFIQYAKRIVLPLRALLIASLTAALFAALGAWILTHISRDQFDGFLPFLLGAIFVYTLLKKDFGQRHQPKYSGGTLDRRSAAIGSGLGLYDGIFGPGTGSFLVFAYVRWFGFDFVHASAMAKGVNVACNIGAITTFIYLGHLIWPAAAYLAIANLAGGIVGSRLALRYGSVWMRRVFIAVVLALLLKLSFS